MQQKTVTVGRITVTVQAPDGVLEMARAQVKLWPETPVDFDLIVEEAGGPDAFETPSRSGQVLYAREVGPESPFDPVLIVFAPRDEKAYVTASPSVERIRQHHEEAAA